MAAGVIRSTEAGVLAPRLAAQTKHSEERSEAGTWPPSCKGARRGSSSAWCRMWTAGSHVTNTSCMSVTAVRTAVRDRVL